MAIKRTDYNSYSTVFTNDANGTTYSVVTSTDANRVTNIRIGVTPGENDTSSFTEEKKKAVHTAIATAISGKIGDGI